MPAERTTLRWAASLALTASCVHRVIRSRSIGAPTSGTTRYATATRPGHTRIRSAYAEGAAGDKQFWEDTYTDLGEAGLVESRPGRRFIEGISSDWAVKAVLLQLVIATGETGPRGAARLAAGALARRAGRRVEATLLSKTAAEVIAEAAAMMAGIVVGSDFGQWGREAFHYAVRGGVDASTKPE